jgi:hypothetical protein
MRLQWHRGLAFLSKQETKKPRGEPITPRGGRNILCEMNQLVIEAVTYGSCSMLPRSVPLLLSGCFSRTNTNVSLFCGPKWTRTGV